MRLIKILIGWPTSWALYVLGDIAYGLKRYRGRDWLLERSSYVQDWCGVGPWTFHKTNGKN
jgi:hypothetical protein